MQILLTSFEPFDGTGLNSSAAACEEFLQQWGSAWQLRYLQLPVEYDADTAAVEAALAAEPVDLLLHTGQATGAERLRVERLAVNVRSLGDGRTRPDPLNGEQRLIDLDGPAALMSTLPVEEAAAALADAGLKARISNHAGIYLCNHVFYNSLRRAAARAEAPQVGFLHIPCLPAQVPEGSDAASLPSEAAALAIETLLQTAARATR